MSSQVSCRALFFSHCWQGTGVAIEKSSALFVGVTEVIQETFKVEVKLVMKKQKREVTRTENFAGKGKLKPLTRVILRRELDNKYFPFQKQGLLQLTALCVSSLSSSARLLCIEN